jgi:tetratricopeptide (TPR) repeat protein
MGKATKQMNKKFFPLLAVLAFMLVGALPGFAQTTAVQGTVKDAHGVAVVNGLVVWHNRDNNHEYKLKTNKKGNYQGLVPIGNYDILTYREGSTEVANKIEKFELKTSSDPFQTYDITVAAEAGSGSTATTGGTTTPVVTPTVNAKELSAEDKKKIEEVNKKNAEIQKENAKIGGVNDLMTQARAAMKATPPDYEKAVTLMQQATQAGNYDLPFGVMGDAQLGEKHYQEAADAYLKAIELNTASSKPSLESQGVWSYNLGRVYVRLEKYPEAQAAFDTAAKDQPTSAAKYYYNQGVELMNIGRIDPAIAAFDKAIAADNKLPDAYYQKGVLMIGKSTTQNGKMVAPAGTEEALNKYLELAPTGPYATTAQELLKELGAKITTRYKGK